MGGRPGLHLAHPEPQSFLLQPKLQSAPQNAVSTLAEKSLESRAEELSLDRLLTEALPSDEADQLSQSCLELVLQVTHATLGVI